MSEKLIQVTEGKVELSLVKNERGFYVVKLGTLPYVTYHDLSLALIAFHEFEGQMTDIKKIKE